MNKSLLKKATSSDDAPTPGYLYNEIASTTFGPSSTPLHSAPNTSQTATFLEWPQYSGQATNCGGVSCLLTCLLCADAAAEMTHASLDACNKVEAFLVSRLSSKKSTVKYKTLVIIKVQHARTSAFGCQQSHDECANLDWNTSSNTSMLHGRAVPSSNAA